MILAPFLTRMVFGWALLFGVHCFAADRVPVPALEARVTDLTHTLSPAVVQALEAKLAAFEARKGSQIAVLIVPTTGPDTVEQFGIRVAEAWKLGRKGIDDGLLLLVAKDDRAVRIEVGYGLEGVVPDAVAKRIIEEIIVPRFKAGDFAGGVDAGVDRLIGVIDGEPLPPAKPPERRRGDPFGNIWLIVIPVIVVGNVLRAMFGRLGGAAVTGGLGFLGGWLLAGSIGFGVGLAVAGFLIVLLGVSGTGIRGGGGRGGGWSSGDGGFSGGGGSFGGGGASGRW